MFGNIGYVWVTLPSTTLVLEPGTSQTKRLFTFYFCLRLTFLSDRDLGFCVCVLNFSSPFLINFCLFCCGFLLETIFQLSCALHLSWFLFFPTKKASSWLAFWKFLGFLAKFGYVPKAPPEGIEFLLSMACSLNITGHATAKPSTWVDCFGAMVDVERSSMWLNSFLSF